jgi:hypothetical protein
MSNAVSFAKARNPAVSELWNVALFPMPAAPANETHAQVPNLRILENGEERRSLNSSPASFESQQRRGE